MRLFPGTGWQERSSEGVFPIHISLVPVHQGRRNPEEKAVAAKEGPGRRISGECKNLVGKLMEDLE